MFKKFICLLLGHQWEPIRFVYYQYTEVRWYDFQCRRCGDEKSDNIELKPLLGWEDEGNIRRVVGGKFL